MKVYFVVDDKNVPMRKGSGGYAFGQISNARAVANTRNMWRKGRHPLLRVLVADIDLDSLEEVPVGN